MDFFLGLHKSGHAQFVDRAFVSVITLRNRKTDFVAREWIMDSGAFSEIVRHGEYRHGVEEYAGQIRRWARCGRLLAAVAQDYMCEPFALAKTGKTLAEHQRMTIERYDALRALDTGGVYVMPVLQGWAPEDYAAHVRAYGDRLEPGAWVGVGSVCKRNSSPREIERVLLAIKEARPDLRLHGFGIKKTSLRSPLVRELLISADSMAWSYAARRNGRNGNDYREGLRYAAEIDRSPIQRVLFQ